MQIGFHGAADTVSASRRLVQTGARRIVLECGLLQGFKVRRGPVRVPQHGEQVEV
jgi:metallo-beta-lactamase family protein